MPNSSTTSQALFGRALCWIETALQAEIRFPPCGGCGRDRPAAKANADADRTPKPKSSSPNLAKRRGYG